MADVVPAGAAPAADAAAPAARGAATTFQSMFGGIARMALIWYVMSWMKGGKAPPPGPDGSPAALPQALLPRFGGKGVGFDMSVYMSESSHLGIRFDPSELIWTEHDVPFAVGAVRELAYEYIPSLAVQQQNASVFLHVVFAKSGSPTDVDDPQYDPANVFTASHSLIRYMAKPKKVVGKNLLGGENGPSARSLLPWLSAANATDNATAVAEVPLTPEAELALEEEAKVFVSWFKPNITISMVDHFQAYQLHNVPVQVREFLVVSEDSMGKPQYDPVVHFDEFWLLREKHVQMNETVGNVTLHLKLSPMSMTWWQIMHQMDKSFSMQVDMGMSKEGESEELKRVILEGNPILLAITMCVSLLHTVFDMLAFKNDIGFWKNNKSMEGLSARSVIINACCQLVILLYLIENDTSYVVLFSSFLGTVIEFWKVTKAMKVEVKPTFPYLTVGDRASYEETPTKKYDKEAMTYLGWVMYPLLFGYCIYTLMYQSHKSWYSWAVGSCVGAVYMFGFILMCPQLYLNYKLKSVAHLPWRQMTYKFLNTIIDDLFAFVIKMPILHRLSVFRDDLIFLIFIYQRWIYRVDATRVNEFGFSGAEPAADPAAITAASEEDDKSVVEPTLIQDGTAAKAAVADVQKATGKGAKKDK